MQPINHLLAGLLAETNALPGGDKNLLQEISRTHNEGFRHAVPWDLLLVGLGTTMIVIVVISMRRWWLRRYNDPSPLVLFSAIARKAGLSLTDRFVLWRIAQTQDLPTPIALLLAKGTLRHYAQQYAAGRPLKSQHRLDRRIAHIEAELFG